MAKNYLYEDRENLVNIIHKIKNKEKLINIYKILSTENLSMSYNNNGIFILFNNISNSICAQIEEYILSSYSNINKINCIQKYKPHLNKLNPSYDPKNNDDETITICDFSTTMSEDCLLYE